MSGEARVFYYCMRAEDRILRGESFLIRHRLTSRPDVAMSGETWTTLMAEVLRHNASSGAVSGVPARNLAMGKVIAAIDSPGSTGPQHDRRMLGESASQRRGRRTTCGVPEYTLNGA
jgi:hypothetical protein